MEAPTPLIVRVPSSGADAIPQAAAPVNPASAAVLDARPPDTQDRRYIVSPETETPANNAPAPPSPAAKPAAGAADTNTAPPVTSEAIAAEPKAPAQNLMETRFETAQNIAPAPVAQVVTTNDFVDNSARTSYGYTRTGNAAPPVASSMYSLAALAVAGFLFVGWKSG